MPEIWKPVPGYEGIYEVSDQGRVRSLDRTITRSDGVKVSRAGRLLTPQRVRSDWGGGYLSVSLGRGAKHRLVHRLVMSAFVGPAPPELLVRHMDGNGMNNRLDNLRYGTHAQNQIDIYGYGGTPGLGKLTPRDAEEIVKLHDDGLSYTQIANRFPVSKSTVARVVHGQFDWGKRGLLDAT